MIPRVAALLLLLVCGGCFRSDERELLLHIPAASAEDLRELREHLLSDHLQLPEDMRHYRAVEVIPSPPSLRVRYDSRQIAARNIEHSVRERGFAVNDLPPP